MRYTHMERVPRLFVDMDGTLAVFRQIDCMERLYEKGYFFHLEPIQNTVDMVKRLCIRPEHEVYILSAVVNSPYAEQEKNEWLNRYLPEIPSHRRVFLPCGENKAMYLPNGIGKNDILLDDYTKNLLEWPEKGIKLLNGINNKSGRWQGDCLDASLSPDRMAQQLLKHLQPSFNLETTSKNAIERYFLKNGVRRSKSNEIER